MDKKDKENLIVEYFTTYFSQSGTTPNTGQIIQAVASAIASGELDKQLKTFCESQKAAAMTQKSMLATEKANREQQLTDAADKYEQFATQLDTKKSVEK